MFALVGLGNRAAGAEGWGTIKGTAIMTLGMFLSHPALWAVPIYAALIFLWRCKSPKDWNTVGQGGAWLPGIIRGMYCIPLAVALFLITHSWWHLLAAPLVSALVPACYWLGFKYKKQPGELAEFLSGMTLGII